MAAILCVDDNVAHTYAFARVLRHAGCEVLEAHNVADAFQIVVNQKPALVLLDVHLPDSTGYDLLRRLKDDPSTRKIPVILHSATADTSVARATAEQLGAECFLTFPIETRDLLSVIRGVLVRRGDNSFQIDLPSTK